MQGRRFRCGELSNLLFEFAGIPGKGGRALHHGLRMRTMSYTISACPAVNLVCQYLMACGAGVVGLHNGLPPSAAFPIKGITLRLVDDTTVDISDPAEVRAARRLPDHSCPSCSHVEVYSYGLNQSTLSHLWSRMHST